MALLATTEAISVGEILLLHKGHAISVVVVVVSPVVANGGISLEKTQSTLQSLWIVAFSQVWVQMPICQGGFEFSIPSFVGLFDEENSEVLFTRCLLNLLVEYLLFRIGKILDICFQESLLQRNPVKRVFYMPGSIQSNPCEH